MQVLYELQLGGVSFCGGKKTGEPGEKPSEQGENQQQQTQLTRIWHWARIEPKPHLFGGRRALSPLRHPCSASLYHGRLTDHLKMHSSD